MSGFKLGELILSCTPYVCVLSDSYRGNRCDYCFKEEADLKQCAQCLFVGYCNKLCQKKAWKLHKLECNLIKETKLDDLPDNLRMLALIVLKMKRDGDENPSVEVHGRKVTFKSLMSHAEEIEKDLTRYEEVLALKEALSEYLPPSDMPLTPLIIQIFGKIATNSFCIRDVEMNSLGTGLYLGASVFDHSCEPDAEVAFNGVDIIIRAVKDIPHRDINKIYVSYIDPVQLTKDRQSALKEGYYFTCKCSRCSSSNNDDLMSKLLVPEDDVKDKLREFKEGVELLHQMRDDDNMDPLSLYTAALDQLAAQDKILADSHLLKGKTIEVICGACVAICDWHEAASMGKRLLKFFRLYYGPYHPQVGLQLFNIAKVEALLNMSSSTKTFQKADTVLKVAYGEDHPYKDYPGMRRVF